MKNGWSGGQYSVFRIFFGCYLLQHFLALLPWGAELFSNRGAVANASASPLTQVFPNVLAICDQPGFVTALLILASVLSVLLAAGLWDRTAAFVLWYLWACLLGRNPLISNPALPFIGCLLFFHRHFQRHRLVVGRHASATILLGIGTCRNSPSPWHGY